MTARVRKFPWREEFRVSTLSFVGWGVAFLIGKSTRLRVVGYEHVEEMRRRYGGVLCIGWHGRVFLPIYFFRGQGVCAIISLSRDGEFLDRIFKRFGGISIRGSTNRDGLQALRSAVRLLRQGVTLTFTPDGPRGPARQVQLGTLYLAQLSQKPIVPCGSAAHPAKFLSSWDEFMIPFPFSQAVITFGEPLWVPRDTPPEQLPYLAGKVKQALDEMNTLAEAGARGEW